MGGGGANKGDAPQLPMTVEAMFERRLGRVGRGGGWGHADAGYTFGWCPGCMRKLRVLLLLLPGASVGHG